MDVKKNIEKVTKNKTLQEFKEFISRGNILDMAVGVVMGTAFKEIINSVVDIFMQMVGLAMGGVNFEALSFTIKDATINYGAFIQNIIDFLVIAVCLFAVIKIMAAFHRKKEEAAEEAPAEPVKSDETVLLEEIRDLLKNK